MRISDWSSDVCSSDLVEQHAVAAAVAEPSLEHRLPGDLPRCAVVAETVLVHVHAVDQHAAVAVRPRRMPGQRRALEPVVAGVQAGRQLRMRRRIGAGHRSEEHTYELQSLMRLSYADFCLKKK